MSSIDILATLDSLSCEDLEKLFHVINLSSNTTQNNTYNSYISLLHTLHCTPKPYLGVQGIKKWIATIILIGFLVSGLVGNILSATIMFRRARRGLSSYFYLALLAIADICILYTGGLLALFDIAFGYHPELYGTHYCRLGFYIKHLFTYFSAWLIVAVTFERFIVVCFPLESIRICRLHVAYSTTLCIGIFFSVYTSHGFFTIGITQKKLQTEQGYHPDFKSCDLIKHQRVLGILDLCFYSVIPSLLIIIFNLLIISTMYYAIKQRKSYLQASSCLPTTNTFQGKHLQKNKSSSSMRTPFFRSRSVDSIPAGRTFISHGQLCRSRSYKSSIQKRSQRIFDSTSATGLRLTFSLLIISFIFVLCTLPISVRSLILDYFPGHKSTARWQITQLILTILMYLNHTINFVLYCLTGRAFRRECRKLLGDLWRFKDIHISCIINPKPDKHYHYHQQMTLTNRTRIILPQKYQQEQRIKRSYL